MELTIKERILLLQILPKESNYTMLLQIKAVEEAIGFTDAERGEYSFVNEVVNGQEVIKWDDSKPQKKEIVLTEKGSDVIKGALKSISRESKLPMEMLELYEKFIEPTRE